MTDRKLAIEHLRGYTLDHLANLVVHFADEEHVKLWADTRRLELELEGETVARCKLTAEEVKAIRDEVAKDLEDYPDD